MPWIETRNLATGTTYRVRWRLAGKSSPETSPAFDTEEEAKNYLTLLEAERITTGKVRNLTRAQTPFSVVAKLWYDEWAPNKADSTKRNRKSSMQTQLVGEFGDTPIGQITRSDIQAWINDNDAEPSSMATYYGLLGMIFRWAQLEDYLPSGNPVGKGLHQLPRGQRRKTFLHQKELDHLLDVARAKFTADYAMVHLEAHTGMRLGEILGLPRTAYDADAETVRVWASKTDTERIIQLFPCCVPVLDAHLKGHDYDILFPGEQGAQQYGTNWRRRVWYKLAEEAGWDPKELHFHDLRHTHASWLLAHGWDVVTVAQRLGHASSKMTLDVYGHAHTGQQLRLIKQEPITSRPRSA